MNNACKQVVPQNSTIACRHAQRAFVASWIFVSSFLVCLGRCRAQAPTISMDSAARSQVVEAAAKTLEDKYIFPDLGIAMAKMIRQQNAAHAYDALTTGVEFSRQLTADLYSVGHDKHIHVDSDDTRLVIQERPGSGGPGPRPHYLEGPPQAARVSEFKRLTGNIGYIRVDQMLPADGPNESIDTAMAALTGSKALIIDLRHNGGGDPMMVAYLCTYLFPAGARIHLSDFVNRDDPAPRGSYTLPSVPDKTFAGDVYLLTSHFTFSGGEEMAYDLQALKRVTIVGETTGGGANPGGPVPLPDHFSIFIPTGRPINPVTKTNWEGVGVQPDVSVPADEALEKATFLALRRTEP